MNPNTRPTAQQAANLGFLLDNFCDANPDIAHALAVATDGMAVAFSKHVSPETRDQLAACGNGQMNLACGMAGFMQAGRVAQIVIDMDAGWIVIQQPTANLVLVVLASSDADLAKIEDALQLLGEQVGEVLDPGPRVPA
jgi:predicted regulator of Ras-like GTPase activity (Roadblock/LC7/MglB family)